MKKENRTVFSYDELAFELIDYFGGAIAEQSETDLAKAIIFIAPNLSAAEQRLIIQTAQQMDANP